MLHRQRLRLVESYLARSPLGLLHELDDALRKAERNYHHTPTADHAVSLARMHTRAGNNQAALDLLGPHHHELDHDGRSVLHDAAVSRVAELHRKHRTQGSLEHHELDQLHHAVNHSVGSAAYLKLFPHEPKMPDDAHHYNAPGVSNAMTIGHRRNGDNSLSAHTISRRNGNRQLHHDSMPAHEIRDWHPNGVLRHHTTSYRSDGHLHREEAPASNLRLWHPNGSPARHAVSYHRAGGGPGRIDGPSHDDRRWHANGNMVRHTVSHTVDNEPHNTDGPAFEERQWHPNGKPKSFFRGHRVGGGPITPEHLDPAGIGQSPRAPATI
jgi:hypothetical protein